MHYKCSIFSPFLCLYSTVSRLIIIIIIIMCIRADTAATFEAVWMALLRANLWFTCQHDVVAPGGQPSKHEPRPKLLNRDSRTVYDVAHIAQLTGQARTASPSCSSRKILQTSRRQRWILYIKKLLWKSWFRKLQRAGFENGTELVSKTAKSWFRKLQRAGFKNCKKLVSKTAKSWFRKRERAGFENCKELVPKTANLWMI